MSITLRHNLVRELISIYREFFTFKCGNGTFVEFGARNGILHSNTYFFEKGLGWSGLLFEADQREYIYLKRNRPNSKVFNGAVCPHKNKDFVNISISLNGGWSGMENTYPLQRRSTLIKRDLVRCYHLATELKKLNMKHIDLMTIDTEGSEYEIISSFPWRKFQIHVVMIESLNEKRYTSQYGNKKRILQFMKNKGYKLYHTLVVAPSDTDDLIFTKVS